MQSQSGEANNGGALRSLRPVVARHGGKTAKRVVCDFVQDGHLRLHWRVRRALLAEAEACHAPQDWYELAQRHLGEGSQQIADEIFPFLDEVSRLEPAHICEIGTANGGTTLLLMRSVPHVREMIGLDILIRNKPKLKLLAKADQRLEYVVGPSAESPQVGKVSRLLGGALLDVLFIDGDHEFEGVRADFLAYRSFVRDGGLIVFHDIVPDRRSEGVETMANAGGVPDFWQLVKRKYETREFVHNWEWQQGYAIGVVYYQSSVPIVESDLVRA